MKSFKEITEAAPKSKKVGIYGSEISGLKSNKGKMYTAKPVIQGGKLAYRVVDEFGSFDTLNLKAFAKMFG